MQVCSFLKGSIALLIAAFSLPAGVVTAGELAVKAAHFDSIVAEQHIPRGMVVNLRLEKAGGPHKPTSFGDATIWTGAYIASQVYRYRVNKDEKALINIEKCLWALVHLHAMAGNQGFIGRAFGTREELGKGPEVIAGVGSYSHLFFKADTSRDQYTGIFMGCALAWQHIRDDKLREEVRRMIAAAARNLMANNLSLKAEINGFSPSTFNLNPDYAYQDRINPKEWATVDDFPANVLTAKVAYSDRLAQIIARFKPPAVRGGEALRALLMFQTASNITEDPQICEYFTQELLGRRKLHIVASETSQLLSDIYFGRNLPVVKNRIFGISVAIGKVIMQILAMQAGTPNSIAIWLEPVTVLPVIMIAEVNTDLLLRGLAYLRAPGNFALFALLAERLESYAGSLRWLKAAKLADQFHSKAQLFNSIAGSNIDEFADTMRSYVGCNISFFALLGILDQPADQRLHDAALSIVPRALEPIADEANSMYSFIEGAFMQRSFDDYRLAAARKTLQLYPANCENRHFDHSNTLKHSLWPDRFGRYDRQSMSVIPIDQRGPHIFIWQEPPRMLVTGADDHTLIAPVGYLLAYWFGRYHDLLRESD